MERIFILVISLVFCSTAAEAASCSAGWIPYKDELCIHLFTDFVSFDDAKDFCASQGSGTSLVMIKEAGLQELLVEYTDETYDNIWLGVKYDSASEEYKWLDGEPFNYTNWQEGYPTNDTNVEHCVEFRPPNARLLAELKGKWADVACQKRNLVMCQTALTWTLQDAVDEIIRIRKQHQEDINAVKTEHADTKQSLESELADTKQNLQSVSSRVVPVGSIYIEYNGQPSPRSLWPSLTWEDITSTYTGVFFRALGGGSDGWGIIQSECAPRITQMEYAGRAGDGYAERVDVPASGWSPHVQTAHTYSSGAFWGRAIRVNTQGCEVRPKNQAVRIWKRSG